MALNADKIIEGLLRRVLARIEPRLAQMEARILQLEGTLAALAERPEGEGGLAPFSPQPERARTPRGALTPEQKQTLAREQARQVYEADKREAAQLGMGITAYRNARANARKEGIPLATWLARQTAKDIAEASPAPENTAPEPTAVYPHAIDADL